MVLMDIGGGTITLLVLAALVIAALVILGMNYRKVGPNEVLIISGGKRLNRSRMVQCGGRLHFHCL